MKWAGGEAQVDENSTSFQPVQETARIDGVLAARPETKAGYSAYLSGRRNQLGKRNGNRKTLSRGRIKRLAVGLLG